MLQGCSEAFQIAVTTVPIKESYFFLRPLRPRRPCRLIRPFSDLMACFLSQPRVSHTSSSNRSFPSDYVAHIDSWLIRNILVYCSHSCSRNDFPSGVIYFDSTTFSSFISTFRPGVIYFDSMRSFIWVGLSLAIQAACVIVMSVY